MLAIRIWNGAMGLLTLLAVAPYFLDTEATMARDGLTASFPEGVDRVVVAFGMQGIAMGLYCLWGAVDSKRAIEALRFLSLYMICISIGRAMAAAGQFSDLGSQPIIYFALDSLITIIGLIILYRGTRKEII